MSCAQHSKYSRIISCAQHPKLPIFVECIIESMTQTSGLCRAHSSSFTDLLFGPELNKERHGQVTQMGKGIAVEDQGQRILYQVGTERRFSTFMFVPERSQTMLGGQVRYFVLG